MKYKKGCIYLDQLKNYKYYKYSTIECHKAFFTHVVCEIQYNVEEDNDENKIVSFSNAIDGQYTCSTGAIKCVIDEFCINVKHVCDGFNDCFDKSDEENCTELS